MRQIKLTDIRAMEMVDVPSPKIENPDDVLLRMDRVGICGSDVHYYTTGRIGCQVVDFPFAVGHECSAVVEAVGSAVQSLKPGDKVAVDPAVSCFHCDQCLNGRPHTCRSLKFLGCPGQLEGCLGDLLVMPEKSLFPIPAGMSMDEAAMIEPLSIGLYAVKRSVPMEGARIAILGSGPIGLSVMVSALAYGAEKTYTTDTLDYRCALAAENGAVWSGNPDALDIVQAITDREPLLLDAVFECCGRQEALDQAIQLVKPGGKVMVIGIPEFDRYSFAADIARRHEICIQHVRRQNDSVHEAIDLVATGRIDPNFMITHRLPFEETKQAFDLVDHYADGVVKAMVEF